MKHGWSFTIVAYTCGNCLVKSQLYGPRKVDHEFVLLGHVDKMMVFEDFLGNKDIIGGLSLVAVLMAMIFPFSDFIDHYQLTNPYAPLVTIAFMLLLQIIYPKTERWTPARGDTAVIMGTGTGFALGSWLNYRLGVIRGPPIPPPYMIMWPGYKVFGLALLRAIIGISCIVATRAFFKSVICALLCFVLRVDSKDLKSKQKIIVEIPLKFITYTAIGFVITYVSPFVFRLLCIERATAFTEV
ncbi:sphingosine-1-phosphate phosphatase 2 [Caerostris extrusa]|uniref:Sphingosine-1-phosphate phosphatase 2 n=1 Tax=Caerostris extrusa TaxID=172846 RepID=A0AAV4P6M7_CAEEX|nr:sphingosine-1-phosphate phosphatase 2 [Caerostris extrusa]